MKTVHRKKLKHFEDAGHAHFLTFSCNHRLPLFSESLYAQWFMESLSKACHSLEYDLWAYVLMPEHAHLIVFPRQAAYKISALLQKIKQPVSRRAKKWMQENDRRCYDMLASHSSAPFRFWLPGGGYDRNLYSWKEVRKTVEYIHYNPVRRELAETTLEWPWSSARWHEIHPNLDIDLNTLLEHI